MGPCSEISLRQSIDTGSIEICKRRTLLLRTPRVRRFPNNALSNSIFLFWFLPPYREVLEYNVATFLVVEPLLQLSISSCHRPTQLHLLRSSSCILSLHFPLHNRS